MRLSGQKQETEEFDMKKTTMITITAMACGLLIATQASAGVFKKRSKNQKHRIRHGILTGQLTRAEARFLKQEQRRIHRIKRIYGSDGRLTHKERRRLDKLQNKASSHIYRFKHNDRLAHRGYRY